MITLHRLGHPASNFIVNHDMIVCVEANPDTVIRLTGGDKIVVAEAPAEVADKMLDVCRAQVMSLRRCGWRTRPPASAEGVGISLRG